jgi:23S rRNA-/tRNA-specific pseudouridylate synthase
MLHARRLGFVHPSTGVFMAFETPIPKDMADVIARCS